MEGDMQAKKELTVEQLAVSAYLEKKLTRLMLERNQADLEIKNFILGCAKELGVPQGWQYKHELKAFIPVAGEEEGEGMGEE